MSGNRKEYIEVSLNMTPEIQESFSSFLIEIGALGSWIEGDTVKGFFSSSHFSCEDIERELIPFFDGFKEEGIVIPSSFFHIQQNVEMDWNMEWKMFFKPLHITSHLIVSPPWEKVEEIDADQKVIWIDPGLGFGTGTHPTTKNCLVFLDQVLSGSPQRSLLRVLDLGAGSGILSIAAAKLGAGEILAVDIDGDAIESMRHNFVINQVNRQIRLRLGSLFQADRGSYHLVMANITSEDLIRLSVDLERAILPGGNAILSGILVEKKEEIDRAFGRLKLSKLNEIIEEKWVTQIWRKIGSPL